MTSNGPFRRPHSLTGWLPLLALLLLLPACFTTDRPTDVHRAETQETTLVLTIASSADDGDEGYTGYVDLADPLLRFGSWNGTLDRDIAMRFSGVPLPPGAEIVSAHLQFHARNTYDEATIATIAAEPTGDAAPLSNKTFAISARPRTSASVAWEPPLWENDGEAGAAQRTPDLAAVIQEVVDHPEWQQGNAMLLLIDAVGGNRAHAYDSDPAKAPQLHLTYRDPAPPPATVAIDAFHAAPAAVEAGAEVVFHWSLSSSDNGPVACSLDADGDGVAEHAGDPCAASGSYTHVYPAAGDVTAELQATHASGASTAATVVVTVSEPTPTGPPAPPPVPATTVERRVSASTDDAEEYHEPTGHVDTGSSDLEMTQEYHVQTVGLRFTELDIPQGALIAGAHLQFQVDEPDHEPTALTIHGQASDDAATFGGNYDISSRPRTSAVVSWSPERWVGVGSVGPEQRSTDLAAVIQEIVDRPGWQPGNALALIVDGSGKRVAESYDGKPEGAPLLVVEYRMNSAPLVDAGPDATVLRADGATLAGSASDDGLPGGTLAVGWSVTSAPEGATVSFADPTDPATGVTFSASGVYTLELHADDGALSSSDTVTVLANDAPAVDAGPDRIVALAAPAAPEAPAAPGDPGTVGTVVPLAGSASDDGLPGGILAVGWSVTSAPEGATVSFADPTDPATSATFSGGGVYTLELHADDGIHATSDAVTVIVNEAPVVDAGADHEIALGSGTALAGSASDDGLPSGTLEVLWSVVSGPGSVTFASDTSAATGATFSDAGVYELQLSASDGALLASDTVSVTVVLPNDPPVVDAGPDLLVAFGGDIALAGAVSDDKLPEDTLTVQWTVLSGPGTVAFSDVTDPRSDATFSSGGVYVLQLTADDGLLATSDTVTVTVNEPPVVDAGADQNLDLDLGVDVALAGLVSDDGLPSGTLTVLWSVLSGPGPVIFADPASAATTATFATAGTYELELAANDGMLLAADTRTVEVTEGVRFGTAGDFGGKDSRAGTVMNDMKTRDLDAFLLLGDLSYNEIVPEQAWCDWVHSYLGTDFPFEVVAGNHEEDSKVDGYIMEFSKCMPDKLNSDLGPGGYGVNFAFDLGPVTVIATSPDLAVEGVHYGYDPGSAERQWLVDAIRTAKAEGDWVLVGMHKVCISIGNKSCEIEEHLAQMLIDEGVDLVLQGHDHDYQRSHSLARIVPDVAPPPGAIADDGTDGVYARGAGTVFLIVGSAGRSLTVCSHEDIEYGYFADHFCGEEGDHKGYTVLTITADELVAEYIVTTGDFYEDGFTIR